MYDNKSTKISLIKSMHLFLSMCLLVCPEKYCLDGWYSY